MGIRSASERLHITWHVVVVLARRVGSSQNPAPTLRPCRPPGPSADTPPVPPFPTRTRYPTIDAPTRSNMRAILVRTQRSTRSARRPDSALRRFPDISTAGIAAPPVERLDEQRDGRRLLGSISRSRSGLAVSARLPFGDAEVAYQPEPGPAEEWQDFPLTVGRGLSND